MAKKRKVWGYQPPRTPKLKVPVGIKASAERKATELVETVGVRWRGTRSNMSPMRHPGQRIEISHNVSLDECLEAVSNDQWFQW